jgi:uncharacterized lipoprotein YbaY
MTGRSHFGYKGASTMGRGWGFVVPALALARVVWAASGAPPPQFRGLDWGAAPIAGLRLERAAGTQQTYGNARHEYRPFFGIAVADEEYVFTSGRLTSGRVTVRGEQGFVKLRAELTRRFGPPAIPRADVFHWEWTSPPFDVTLTYDPRAKTAVVTLAPGRLPAPPSPPTATPPAPTPAARAPVAPGATKISCLGTEPAWHLDLDGNVARWAAGNAAEMALSGSARWLEQAKPPVLAWRGRAAPTEADLVAFVAVDACSQAGTSFPYAARVSSPTGDAFVGCCRAPAAETAAVAKPVSVTGGWVRRTSQAKEGVVFRPDGTFRLIGIASMNGVGWKIDGDTLVVTTNTERYPDPTESKLRIEELTDAKLVLGGRVNYFEGTWERRELAQVTGTVTARPPSALPADAIVVVELRDLSASEAPGALIASDTQRAPTAMPIAFRLDYDPTSVDAAHAYAVQARIVAGGQPRFVTDAPLRVITGGSPTQVELLVVPPH